MLLGLQRFMILTKKGVILLLLTFLSLHFVDGQAIDSTAEKSLEQTVSAGSSIQVGDKNRATLIKENEELKSQLRKVHHRAILLVVIILVAFISVVVLFIVYFIRSEKRIKKSFRFFNKYSRKKNRGTLYATDIMRAKKSENMLKGVFNNQIIGITMINSKGSLIFSNQKWLEMIGYTEEEMLQLKAADLAHHEERVYAEIVMKDLIAGRTSSTVVVKRVIRKDGTFFWGNLALSLIPGETPENNLIAGLCTDVSEIQYLKEIADKEKKKYEEILNTVSDCVYSIEHDGNWNFRNTYFSPAIEKITGIATEALIKNPALWLTYIYPEDIPMLKEAYSKIAASINEEHHIDFRIKDLKGTTHYLSLNVIAGYSPDQYFRFNGIIKDITLYKQTEKALRDSEALYRSTINNLSDHNIHVIDHLFTIKVFNTSFKNLNRQLGLTTDAVGKTIFDVFPFLGDKIKAEYNNVFKTKETLHSIDNMEINGKKFFTETYKVPVIENEVVTKVITILKDITENYYNLESVERQKEQYKLLVDNISDLVIQIDPEGKLIYASPSFLRIFNLEQSDLGVTNFYDYIYPEDVGFITQLKSCKEHTPQHFETEFRLKTPTSHRWFSWSFRCRIYNNINILIVGVGRDITEKRLVNKLLEEQERSLHEANKTKDKLFSIIAHDLVSPFNALLGFTGLLHDTYDNLNNEERYSYIKRINESSELLYKMVENLLYWSSSQTDRLKCYPVPIEIKKSISDHIIFFKNTAEKKNIQLSYESGNNNKVLADENMLNTIFRNLISNAIKFTPEGGSIHISTEKTADYIKIIFKDTGIGISEDDINKIFVLGETVKHPGTNRENGTGLGLLVCKEFATKNNGNLTVENNPDKGCRFILALPHYSS